MDFYQTFTIDALLGKDGRIKFGGQKVKDLDAVYFLGICNERGLGTDRNEAKAAELYRSAASRGHSNALYNLAVFFDKGIGGIPQNRAEAERLYHEAAAALGTEAAVDRSSTRHQSRLNVTEKGFSGATLGCIVDSGSSGTFRHTPNGAVGNKRRSIASQFFRSLSNNSDSGSESATTDMDLMEYDTSIQSRRGTVFYLEQSDDEDAADTAARGFIGEAEQRKNQPGSTEFSLLEKVLRRDGPGCIPQDLPTRHSSLGNFVIPKGSFGGAVLPHVSSFG